MTRISDSMFFGAITRYVANAQKRAYAAQTRAQTGLRVNKPSDDPVTATRATVLDAQLSRLKAMDFVSARTQTQTDAAGTALDGAAKILDIVRSAARNSANGSVDATGMRDLATNVSGQQQALLALMNTQTDQGFVFGGYRDRNQPFLANGTYIGDAGVRTAEVSPGVGVQVNVSGAQAFTAAGGVNVYALVDTVRTALAAGDTVTLTANLANIDTAVAQVSAARVQMATSTGAIKTANETRAVLQAQVLDTFDRAMKMSDADASVQMLAAQNSLQAASTMASSVLSMLANINR